MPFRNGGHVFGGHVHRGAKTIVHYFRDLGYQTANLGKFSKHPRSAFPYEVVKSKWSPAEHDAGLIDMLDQFLANRDEDRPLLLEVNTADTHQPWLENERYDLTEIGVPPHLLDTRETRDAARRLLYVGRDTGCEHRQDYSEPREERLPRQHSAYLHVGSRAELRVCQVVLVRRRYPRPFIARWPGVIEPNTTTDAMISLADIVPTVVEAAGGTPSEDIDGRSFLNVLTGKTNKHRDAVFATHTGNSKSYAEWKANWCPARSHSHTHPQVHPESYPPFISLSAISPDVARLVSLRHIIPIGIPGEELSKTDEEAERRLTSSSIGRSMNSTT